MDTCRLEQAMCSATGIQLTPGTTAQKHFEHSDAKGIDVNLLVELIAALSHRLEAFKQLPRVLEH